MPEKPTYAELEEKVQSLEGIKKQLKKTEKMLKDEIHWRRVLIDESNDAIVILDQNAKVFEANKRFADLLGYTMEEVTKLHVWDWDAAFNQDQIMEMADTVDINGHNFETKHRRKDGSLIDIELNNNGTVYRGKKLILCICHDISRRKKAEAEREALIKNLQDSLAEIKTLQGILPLCSYCKKIRNDKGYWEQVDTYISKYSEADISHSICPECYKKYFPNES